MRRTTRSSRNSKANKTASKDEEEDPKQIEVSPSTSSGLRRYLSQDSGEMQMRRSSTTRNARRGGRNAFSQDSANLISEESPMERMRDDSEQTSLHEQKNLAGKIIQYIFVVDKKKHDIKKANIVKHILKGSSRNFQQIMDIVKSFLSKVFGYKLVDIGAGKYILVNEIKNDRLHLKFSKSVEVQQVLLFIILTHIFMHEGACSEETLWDFLQHLEIVKEDNFVNDCFGDIKKLVTVDFIAQHYLQKMAIGKGDSLKYEYKWGPRAEHEVSRRDVLEFMSKVYGGCPIDSWPQQYKEMLATEKSK